MCSYIGLSTGSTTMIFRHVLADETEWNLLCFFLKLLEI